MPVWPITCVHIHPGMTQTKMFSILPPHWSLKCCLHFLTTSALKITALPAPSSATKATSKNSSPRLGTVLTDSALTWIRLKTFYHLVLIRQIDHLLLGRNFTADIEQP